jgi:hypothetical protein
VANFYLLVPASILFLLSCFPTFSPAFILVILPYFSVYCTEHLLYSFLHFRLPRFSNLLPYHFSCFHTCHAYIILSLCLFLLSFLIFLLPYFPSFPAPFDSSFSASIVSSYLASILSSYFASILFLFLVNEEKRIGERKCASVKFVRKFRNCRC